MKYLILLVALVLAGCGGGGGSGGGGSPYPGRPNPVAGQWYQDGSGTGQTGSLSNPFSIPTQSSGHTINYVYTAPASGTTITLNYSVDGNATFAPLPESGCGSGGCGPAKLRLFIWSNNPNTGADRWWCSASRNLVLGDNQVMTCAIDQTWTGVSGQIGSPLSGGSLFAMGFTFGGMFAGHGVWATSGAATFKINSFTVK